MKSQRNPTFIDNLLGAIDECEASSQTKDLLIDIINEKLDEMGGKIDPAALMEALGDYIDVKKLMANVKAQPRKRFKSVDEAEGAPVKRRSKSSLLNQEAVTLLLDSVMSSRGLAAAPDLMDFLQRLMTGVYLKMLSRTHFYVNNRMQLIPPTLRVAETSNPRKVLRSLEEQERQTRDQIATDELKDVRLSRRKRNKEEDPMLDEIEDINEAVQSFDWRTAKLSQFDSLELTSETRRRFTLRDVTMMLQTDMQEFACFFKPKLTELL
jgi:hypothetical protein